MEHLEEAKALLESIKDLDYDISILRERCEEQRNKMFDSPATCQLVATYGLAARGKSTVYTGWTESNINKYLQLSAVLSQKEQERDRIIDMIQEVGGNMQKALYYRYVKRETRDKVADLLNISSSSVTRILNKAVYIFSRVMIRNKGK